MAFTLADRPQFYEGQYLGAADLAAIVQHAHVQRSRHDLGAHTWGIASGLQLREQSAPGGQLDLYILPGYAWDGFGRSITLLLPFRVTAEIFKSLVYDAARDAGTPAGRVVELWLRYDETPAQPPRRGFERCDPDTPYGRVQEGFRIEIGNLGLAEQQDQIIAGDYLLYAKETLNLFDPQTPPLLLEDESVAFQQFPDLGARRRWLIPLGAVRFQPNPIQGQAGSFVARVQADLDYSESLRRYAGVVAGAVQPAGRSIRLRERTRPYASVLSNDLVWVEGNLRVEGNVRLFGTKIEWLEATGQDDGVPLDIRRARNGLLNDTILQVAIGAAAAGRNRFAVGPLIDNPNPQLPKIVDEKFVVLDNGNVGVGTTVPVLKLDIRGDFGRQDGPATLNLFGSRIGDIGGGILFLRSGGDIVAFDGGDRVGVGSTTPRNPLAVRGINASEELISFEDAGGATKWHMNQKVQNRPGLNFAESGVADGRLFLQPGGNVGIGTTNPALRLDIQGDFGRADGAATVNLFGSRIGDIGGGVLFLRSGGNVVAFDGADNIGIGTNAPGAKVEINDGDLLFKAANQDPGDIVFQNFAGVQKARIWSRPLAGAGLHLSSGDNVADISIDAAGNVGIGTEAPQWRFEVNGTAGKATSHWSTPSDERLKQAIAPLGGTLERLLALRGVSFEWKDPQSMGGQIGKQMGFVAQEVELIFPEWVETSSQGYKSLNLQGIEALTIEALRELHTENLELREQVRSLEKRLAALESRFADAKRA